MSDYDSATLSVDPETMNDYINVLTSQAEDVGNLLESVNTTLSALQLGWAGTTADEVQQINDSWTAVMTDLFGTQDNPQDGVINVILGGLLQVAAGYSQTEQALAQMWEQFYNQLLSGSQSAPASLPASAPASISDPTESAVTEEF